MANARDAVQQGNLIGETLRDYMALKSWSSIDLALRMGGNDQNEVRIYELTIDMMIAAIDAPLGHSIHHATLSLETAKKLAEAFGNSHETWLKLDVATRILTDRARNRHG